MRRWRSGWPRRFDRYDTSDLLFLHVSSPAFLFYRALYSELNIRTNPIAKKVDQSVRCGAFVDDDLHH